MNKWLIILAIFVLSVSLTGCNEGPKTSGTFIGGTEGLRMTFLDGSPPPTITDGGTSGFGIIMKIENIGETTVSANDAYVKIQGIDAKIYGAKEPNFMKKFSEQDGFGSEIIGARAGANGNFNGGIGTIEFGELKYSLISQGDVSNRIQAELCYRYTTKVVSSLCVKNNVEQAFGNDKICTVEGAKEVQNSGGPIQVTSITESYAGNGKIGINMQIDHKGTGDAFFKYSDLACNDVPSNANKGKVRIKFDNVQIGGRSVPVICQGMDSEGYVRLYGTNGAETYNLYCSVDASGTDNIVTIPLNAYLDYTYLQSISKDITIRHISQ